MGYFFTLIMFLIGFLIGLAKKTSIFLNIKKRINIIIFNSVFYTLSLAVTFWVSSKIINIVVSWYKMTV